MNRENLRNDRLAPLSELKDYKVAKDNPDVTGWRVVGADGEKLGEVKDLIVDLDAMKTRYLSVVADRRFFDRNDDTYLLVPIGAAALDRDGKNVFLSSIDASSITRYPVYGGGPILTDYEYAVRDNFRRAHRDTLTDSSQIKEEFNQAMANQPASHQVPEDFYRDEAYDEERFYTSNAAAYDRDRGHHVNRPSDTEKRDQKSNPVEESINTIERLEDLRDRGSITEEEFILLKKRALNS